jgi:2'-5' RNA ligase
MIPMRIFIGIKLAAEAKERISEELQPFRKAGTPMRWTGRDNIHLTLKFIGEAADPLAAKVGAALQADFPAMAPFRLRLTGFGKFPAGDDLHVFWAGVEVSPELRALFAGVEDALAPLGIARETRPFHPHITLGRNKAPFNFKSFFALLAEKNSVFVGEWPVSAFQLFSSHLTPAGPEYAILKEIPLVQS